VRQGIGPRWKLSCWRRYQFKDPAGSILSLLEDVTNEESEHRLISSGDAPSFASEVDDGHLLLIGTAGVKFGNDARPLS
jgi:hypothetical protein